jgi:2-methylisocitrate lyase-like PEP mutase family enzyme
MRTTADGPAKFRTLLAEKEFLLLPGVYNALFARVVEESGFPCVYMSGFSVATATLGRPDLGMLGLAEMAEQASRIVSAVDIPVLADADTGYGGLFSIRRTVEEYERAGLAGLHIEDQDLSVKRCGWLGDIEVVSAEAMLERVRAALRARRNEEFFVIARTDARRKLGFKEALRRARLYAREGADAVFVEYLTDIEEVRRLVEAVKIPVVAVVVESEEMLNAEVLKQAGVRIALFPISVLHMTLAAAERVARVLREAGTTAELLPEMVSSENLLKYIRYREMAEWESPIRSRPGKSTEGKER